jgi:3-oxoacyl-[acyl-carrier-protein] synthase-3
MKVDGIYLAGLGSYLPDRVTADEAVRRGWFDPAVRDATGLASVTDAGDMPAPDMAVAAAKIALATSGVDPAAIEAVFHSNVYFQGPDGWSAHHYILRHTIDRPIPAMEIRQGCNGLLASIHLASCFLLAVPEREAVLLTAADNFNSPLLNRWTTSKLFVLGDAGAAVVLSKHRGIARVVAVGSLSLPRMEELHRGGEDLFPPPITLGKPMDLEARVQYWREQWAKGVIPPMGSLGDTVAGAVKQTLAEADLDMSDVKRVAHVSFGIEGVRQWYLGPIGVDESVGTWDFGRTTGHCGPADPILGLEHLIATRQVEPGDHVVLVGAAPGMEGGCVVVQITDEAA